MNQSGATRATAARNRQLQRESLRRRRELERQAKEMAKLSALEQARLEVETFENSLDVLLSVHKEPPEQWDWIAIASDLRPLPPIPDTQFEMQARHEALLNYKVDGAIETAQQSDKRTFQAALEKYANDVTEMETLRALAIRILDGEGLAFLEAFAQFNPVAEFSSAGSLRKFAVERPNFIDCVFKVDFENTIPNDVKTLTATGKLSVKPMTKARRHDLYQDYVSACSLRMAGEIFAMLPVEKVVVTAIADIGADSSGAAKEVAILSVLCDRAKFEKLDFGAVTPARAIEQFLYRCNFKSTRGSGAFQAVVPLSVGELPTPSNDCPCFERLIVLIQELQDEIRPRAVVARAMGGNKGEAT